MLKFAIELEQELAARKVDYRNLLASLEREVRAAQGDSVSDHLAHNLHSRVAAIGVLAGKIKQTENVIRWMGEAK